MLALNLRQEEESANPPAKPEDAIFSDYNGFQFAAPLDSTANKIRGVPSIGRIVYDYTPTPTNPNGVLRIYPEIQQETWYSNHVLSEKPIVISASLVKKMIIDDNAKGWSLSDVSPVITEAIKQANAGTSQATKDRLFRVGN